MKIKIISTRFSGMDSVSGIILLGTYCVFPVVILECCWFMLLGTAGKMKII